eukprot:gene938-1020_t
MGCSSSKTALHVDSNSQPSEVKSGKRKSKKSAKDEDPQEIPDSEVHKMREDILQRHDSEVDIIAQISAEREALRMISTVKIERRDSCEDFFDLLSTKELAHLSDSSSHYKQQKGWRAQQLRTALANRNKQWMLLNNLEAISSDDLMLLATFLLRIVRAIQKKAEKGDSSRNRPSQGVNAIDLTQFRHLERSIRAMRVVTMAPLSSFRVTEENLYDFDLPPGLVTMHEARLIIDVYRRGGKLIPKAVHKLLRLSFRILKNLPNTSHVTVRPEDKLTVVGDIHGQLADLFHILDAAGLPTSNNKYIFNGDFVDRGPHGVEVMCVLLALFIARPDCVVLNRGNHEDFAICSVYGFQLECYEKYDPLTFGLFVEVFQQIPLFTIVNDAIFVVHGGLFHCESTTLEDLDRIHRVAFSLEEMPEEGEALEGVGRDNEKIFLQQLIRDALWSDPIDLQGKHPSARGAGVSFGPDVVEAFLLRNSLKFVIRSHECVRSGYDEPYTIRSANSAIGGSMLCTIFSASDYGGSGNSAAYMEFSVVPPEELSLDFSSSVRLRKSSTSMTRQYSMTEYAMGPVDNMSEAKLVHGTNLQYTVHYFYATPLHFDSELSQENPHRDTTLDLPSYGRDQEGDVGLSMDSTRSPQVVSNGASRRVTSPSGKMGEEILIGSSISIEELICVRKQLLLESFEKGDRNLDGQISQQHWLRCMTDVINISLSWRRFARYLIKEEMTSASGAVERTTSEIKYVDFLNSFDDDIIFGRYRDDADSIHNMQALSQYIHSIGSEGELDRLEERGSSTGVVGVEDVYIDNGNVGASQSAVEGGGLSLVQPKPEEHEHHLGQQQCSQPYFGHAISSDVVAAIYPNHEKLEEAFRFFDEDEDGAFSLHDLLRGCLQLDLMRASASSTSSSSTDSPSSTKRSYLYSVEEIQRLMAVMDVFECGVIDINVFFEIVRLSLLNTSMQDDEHWTKPLLTREVSHAHELYRLSHYVLPGTPLYGGTPQSGPHIHASQLSAMASVELKKGVEIGVDSELISNTTESVDQVGLSIDI